MLGSRKSCAVVTCQSTENVLHMLPQPRTNKELFLKWVSATGRDYLTKLDPWTLQQACRICCKHFEKQNYRHNNTLKDNALPTLHLPEPVDVSSFDWGETETDYAEEPDNIDLSVENNVDSIQYNSDDIFVDISDVSYVQSGIDYNPEKPKKSRARKSKSSTDDIRSKESVFSISRCDKSPSRYERSTVSAQYNVGNTSCNGRDVTSMQYNVSNNVPTLLGDDEDEDNLALADMKNKCKSKTRTMHSKQLHTIYGIINELPKRQTRERRSVSNNFNKLKSSLLSDSKLQETINGSCSSNTGSKPDLCRICLNGNREHEDLFSSSYKTFTLHQLLETCVPIKIERNSQYPYICGECKMELIRTYTFVRKCVESDKVLHSGAVNLIEPVDEKVGSDEKDELKNCKVNVEETGALPKETKEEGVSRDIENNDGNSSTKSRAQHSNKKQKCEVVSGRTPSPEKQRLTTEELLNLLQESDDGGNTSDEDLFTGEKVQETVTALMSQNEKQSTNREQITVPLVKCTKEEGLATMKQSDVLPVPAAKESVARSSSESALGEVQTSCRHSSDKKFVKKYYLVKKDKSITDLRNLKGNVIRIGEEDARKILGASKILEITDGVNKKRNISTNDINNQSSDVKHEMDDEDKEQARATIDNMKNAFEQNLQTITGALDTTKLTKCYVLENRLKINPVSRLRSRKRPLHGTYSCRSCRKIFKDESQLEDHRLTRAHRSVLRALKRKGRTGSFNGDSVTDENAYLCDRCGSSFRHITYLHRHISGVHEGFRRHYTCTECNKSFTSATSYRCHQNKHAGTTFCCELCGKLYGDKSHLKRHLRTHSALRKFVCVICSKGFLQKSHLDVHMLKHTNVKMYKCEICDLEYSRQVYLNSHLKSKHPEGWSAKTDLQFVCDKCDRKFVESKDFYHHLSVRHKYFKCYICNKKSTSYGAWYRHKYIHNRKYVCRYCQKACITLTTLRHHEALHTGEKNYECDVCGKGFIQKSHLTVHQASHTHERKYMCDYCGKGFLYHSSLVVHKRLHTGNNPYECKICAKSFAHATNYRKHMLGKHTIIVPRMRKTYKVIAERDVEIK